MVPRRVVSAQDGGYPYVVQGDSGPELLHTVWGTPLQPPDVDGADASLLTPHTHYEHHGDEDEDAQATGDANDDVLVHARFSGDI